MRKSLLALALFAPMAFGQTQTFTYTYNGLPLPIYPNDWNTWSYMSVLVPRSIAVTKVTVAASVQYSGVGDLNVYLWSASGTRSKLLERNCGSLQNIDTTFDDSAPSMYHDVCPAQAGTGPFRGNEPLANSVGENAFGYWRLGVENNGSPNTGTSIAFTLTITGTALGPPSIGPRTVISTASFDDGEVAPGDQVSIIGVNLGPVGGVQADASKNLPTSLGQTTVTFDNVAVPLYFVSDKLVAVHVPVTLVPGSTTRIQVMTAAAGAGTVVTLPVVEARPGIFTHDDGGRGQARVINQDGSLNGDGSINGSDVPAKAGSLIEVYTSGLGPVDPPIPEGTPAPSSPLSTVTLPVTASIGGIPAIVTYAGLAPGQVGIYQVNIRVPTRAPSGANRLEISVDGNNSQNTATVQIK